MCCSSWGHKESDMTERGHLHKSREARVSCLYTRKTSRDLLQHVSRPDSPTMAREH